MALLEGSLREMTLQSVVDGAPGSALCLPTPMELGLDIDKQKTAPIEKGAPAG
jgi:hypothetical protein